jgi:hypothetical protein
MISQAVVLFLRKIRMKNVLYTLAHFGHFKLFPFYTVLSIFLAAATASAHGSVCPYFLCWDAKFYIFSVKNMSAIKISTICAMLKHLKGKYAKRSKKQLARNHYDAKLFITLCASI